MSNTLTSSIQESNKLIPELRFPEFVSHGEWEDADFISLTDIAKYKTDDTNSVIANWMRNRNTIEFLGIWETLYNPVFKPLEFEGFSPEARYLRISSL